MGIPGAVSTRTAASVERFFTNQWRLWPGQISWAMRALPLATSSCDST